MAGTLINTPDGKIPIEKIQIGDNVYAFNTETKRVEVKKVTETFVKETNKLCHVITQNEIIYVTEEHPFWVSGKGWVPACDLKSGDKLYLQQNKYVEVINVVVEVLDKPVTVYNFEVDNLHNYFIGSESILVHNKCNLKML